MGGTVEYFINSFFTYLLGIYYMSGNKESYRISDGGQVRWIKIRHDKGKERGGSEEQC